MRVLVLVDVLHPAAQLGHGFLRQRQQRRFGWPLLRQHRVENLFHRPGGFTELTQPNHPGAALEGVERTAQDRELLQLTGFVAQRLERGQSVAHHFTTFLQEDVAQIVFAIVIGRRADRGHLRHRHRRNARLGQSHQCLGTGHGVAADHGLGRLARGACHTFLFSQRCLVSQRVELFAQFGQVHIVLGAFDHALDVLAQRFSCVLRRKGHRHFRSHPPHERPELARLVVEHKQLLRQRWLVVEHVHEETQGTEVVAQLLEGPGLSGHVLVDFGVQDLLDRRAHAGDGLHRLFKAQHREHAAHLHQLGHCHVQPRLFLRRPEELVQRLLRLAQRHLQFADHAAQRLAIADAAVELLHPRFEGLGRLARQHPLQTLGQQLGAVGQCCIVGIKIVERRFQVQGGGRDLH